MTLMLTLSIDRARYAQGVYGSRCGQRCIACAYSKNNIFKMLTLGRQFWNQTYDDRGVDVERICALIDEFENGGHNVADRFDTDVYEVLVIKSLTSEQLPIYF